MFYSYKNFPVLIRRYIAGTNTLASTYNTYSGIVQNLSLNANQNVNFPFVINKKTPYRGVASDAATTTIGISFVSQAPRDLIFINNILATGGIKNTFSLTCGNVNYTNGYLQSFNTSFSPNNLTLSQAEFVFYNSNETDPPVSPTPYPPFSPSTLPQASYNIDNNNYYSHGASVDVVFSDSLNEFNSNTSDLLKLDFSYKADIQSVYEIGADVPTRVIFNREEIDVNIELNSYNPSTRYINDIVNNLNIKYYGYLTEQFIEIQLQDLYLTNKNFSLRTNDILNSKISLKCFI